MQTINNQNWSTAILGARIFGRKCIGLIYPSISEILTFMQSKKNFHRGVLLSTYEKKTKLISNIGKSSKILNIKQIFDEGHVCIRDDVLSTDFIFIPFKGNKYPKTASIRELFAWAVDKRLPYIYQHDNDVAWFSNFSSSFGKSVFCWFLSNTIIKLNPEDIVLSSEDWPQVREGIYSHGWTLNRMHCSYKNGQTYYTLWAGTPKYTLLGSGDNTCLKNHNKKLEIKIDGNKTHLKILKGKCPLSDDYGKLMKS